jgi:serine protease AprX
VADVRFNSDYNQNPSDGYGHGTHVASIVGGDGSESGGKYIGVAPLVNIINVKVSNDDGSAMMTDVVAGLQWVLENKNTYNIRVVNLSLNSSIAESYHTSPLNAAVEILWFNKIVVVVSAGNHGESALYPPANDPFVITVGAVDDKGTAAISDDVMASFSAYGTSFDGVKKPDLVAPGKNIVARLVNQNMGLANAHPANRVGDQYFRMSGTSMSAPMVSAAVALLLQDEPNLTPDQVKYRLTATANKAWPGYNAAKSGAGYLDVLAAVRGTTTQSANTGVKASLLLTTGSTPITWYSVGWNSVGWNTVGWNTVGWNTVGWNSDYWGP